MNSGRIIYIFAFGATAFAGRSVAMKAPVGLLSGRAVCVSRWRGFAPTSSAERDKRYFHGKGRRGKQVALPATQLFPKETGVADAALIYDPSCENGFQESPQTFLKPEIKITFPLNMARVQQRRPPPVAETGRSCWGSGQQDARAAQGTMRMLGAATR